MSKQQLIDEINNHGGISNETKEYIADIINKHMEGMVIVPSRTLSALSDIQTHADSIYDSYSSEQEELEGWEMELLFKALTAFEDCP